MLKSEVEEKHLSEFVLMLEKASFKTWWRGLLPASIVKIRYPHERHGNAVKV